MYYAYRDLWLTVEQASDRLLWNLLQAIMPNIGFPAADASCCSQNELWYPGAYRRELR